MKRILTTILAFIYISTSVGATIHLHFCMGKLASWGVIDHERNTCVQCGMVVTRTAANSISFKKPCCRDEHKQIKTGTDQKYTPAATFKYQISPEITSVKGVATQHIDACTFRMVYSYTHEPPLKVKLPRFILYSNYRI